MDWLGQIKSNLKGAGAAVQRHIQGGLPPAGKPRLSNTGSPYGGTAKPQSRKAASPYFGQQLRSRVAQLGPNYAAQEKATAATAQGNSDYRSGMMRKDPAYFERKQGQAATLNGREVTWNAGTKSWTQNASDGELRKVGDQAQYFDGLKKTWNNVANYESTPRATPTSALQKAVMTVGETASQLTNPLEPFMRTAAQHGIGNAIEEAGDRGLLAVPIPDRANYGRAVSLKAVLGDIAKPIRLMPGADARQALADNARSEGIFSADGKTVTYSDYNNPNWKGFEGGPGGYESNHMVFGRYRGDVTPEDGGGRRVTVTRDLWDTNRPLADYDRGHAEMRAAGQEPNVFQKAARLVALRQSQGELNRLPMGQKPEFVIPDLPFAQGPQAGGSRGQATGPAEARSFTDLAQLVPQAARGSSYQVNEGDTLWEISRRTGRSVEELQKASGINDANLIRVGQRIAL